MKLSRMKTGRLTILLPLLLLTGCTVGVRLYPVQGPLSAQNPLPVFSGKISGGLNFDVGTVSLAVDCETFNGRWNRVLPSDVAPTSSMWDAVYGSGYYVSHVVGDKHYAKAAITGDKGTLLHVEFYQIEAAENRVHLFGVASDSKGDIYKITFKSA